MKRLWRDGRMDVASSRERERQRGWTQTVEPGLG